MSQAGPLNLVSSLCRIKLLFVSHEAGYSLASAIRNSQTILGGKAIFVLILKNAIFIFIETASEVLILLIS
jgi:hypothetical protein